MVKGKPRLPSFRIFTAIFIPVLLALSIPLFAAPSSNGYLDEQRVQQIISSTKPAVTLIEVEGEDGMGWGSGFFVSSDGILVTCNHVVKRAQKITCLVKNKDKYPAKVLTTDEKSDLAILKVDVPGPVATVAPGDSDEAKEGQLIGVSGYPRPSLIVWMGMAIDSSTSRGSINGQRYSSGSQAYLGDQAIQIDAPVQPGNSGGPVFRLDTGEVIGVLSASAGGNLTLAVPINKAKVMIATQGITLKSNVIAPTSPDAIVEAGDLRTLSTISVSKELPKLFGFSFEGVSYDVERAGSNGELSKEWKDATGVRLPAITSLAVQNEDAFFGGVDGRLRRWSLTNMYSDNEVLLDTDRPVKGDDSDARTHLLFAYPPAVSNSIICAAAGALRLDNHWFAPSTGETILGGLLLGFTGSDSGLLGGKTKMILSGEGALYGLNRSNGNINWQYEGPFLGTPVIYGDKVYYGGIGERGCLESATGKPVWKVAKEPSVKAEWYYIGAVNDKGIVTLVVPMEVRKLKNESYVLFGTGQARVELQDLTTGNVIWKAEIGDIKDRPRPMSSMISLDEKKGIIYATAAQVVAAIDINTGTVNWSYDNWKKLQESKKSKDKKEDKSEPAINFTAAMVIRDDIIYIGSEDGSLYALNGKDGSTLWNYKTRGTVGAPTYYEGQILVGSSDGYIHMIDAQTGALAWRVNTERPLRAQPVVYEGMVLAPLDNGSIFTTRLPAN